MTETLTDDDIVGTNMTKALRIIDALTARAEAAEQKLTQAQSAHAMAVQDRGFADLQRQRAESESAALRERCRLLEVNRDSLLERNGRLVNETHRARAESAALRDGMKAISEELAGQVKLAEGALDAQADAEKRMFGLRAEVERLTDRLREQVESGDAWRTGQAKAENRCHELSAENERLHQVLAAECKASSEHYAQLAAANALLEQFYVVDGLLPSAHELRADKRIRADAKCLLADFIEARYAHLDGQPATPTSCACGHPEESGTHGASMCEITDNEPAAPARTERPMLTREDWFAADDRRRAEQRVLDAANEWSKEKTPLNLERLKQAAELARRGLK